LLRDLKLWLAARRAAQATVFTIGKNQAKNPIINFYKNTKPGR
jgi:hypothetical protein